MGGQVGGRACGRVADYYAHGLTTLGLRVQTQHRQEIFLSCNKFFPHYSPSCDGDLEFSGMQIQWP